MSQNRSEAPKYSKHKHYTSTEKKLFLEILKKYKDVIEIKKCDLTTLKDKEMAWAEIEKEFNLSSLVMQERTVQQLKKLWTNLKQTQRDALTKERQSRFATGGGPAIPLAMIDPDVAIIAPNLMKNAPILFSSNMPEEVVHDRRQQILNNENIDIIMQDSQFEIDDELITDELLDATIPSEATVVNIDSEDMSHAGSSNIGTIHSKASKIKKSTKDKAYNRTYNLLELKLERIRRITKQEEDLATLHKQNQKVLHDLAYEHAKTKYALEIRAATATAQLAELLLKKEMEKL